MSLSTNNFPILQRTNGVFHIHWAFWTRSIKRVLQGKTHTGVIESMLV